MPSSQVGHYRVSYVCDGELFAFGVHTYDDAKWWAMFMRGRWRVPVYIDHEQWRALRDESFGGPHGLRDELARANGSEVLG